MAGTYSYPLLVELEHGNIPKLKNKLVKYFQSKKSNGGDCEVEYEPGSRTAVLRFRREEDQRNVLAKAAHQISLDKGVIKMTVNLPSEEEKTQETPSEKGNKSDVAVTNKESKADEPNPADQVQTEEKGKEADAADEELCSTSAVLENLSERGSEELLQMLVDNILNALAHSSASQGFNLEIIPEISSAVVTFQSGKVNADFIAQCPQNRMFTKLNFSVRPLEVTKQVLVENIQNTNVDMLQLYFENEGGDVDDLNLNEAEQSAVITFEDCQAVQKVLKKKHHIRNEDIKVYPFYKSLGVALYGKDPPSLKLPAATSEPIDSDIWRYLTNNQAAAQSVRSDMAKHFCDANLDQSNVRLSPLSLLLTQKDAKATVKDWTTTVKSAFAQTMSKFKSLKFPVESEVWEESEEKIGQSLLNEDVLVVSEKSSGVLSVVGLVNDVNRQEGTVSEVLNKINQAVQREKTVKTQEIKVSPSMFHILSQDGLQDKLLQVSPELKTHYDKEGAVLKVTGLFNEILEVSKIINDGFFGSKRDNSEVDTFVFDMMKDEQQEELTSALLTSVGINAALEISAQRVQLVALSDKDLLDGQDHLRKCLISQYIDVEDVEVLKKPEWQGLVGQLENANNKACRITQTPQKVVVSGHKDSVKQVSSELSNFLTQNAHVETTVDVKENVIIDYIKSLDTYQVQTEEKGKEADAADEELCSTSAVLENLSERGSEELLQMLVDNILNALAHSSASQGFNLEIIPEISSAVVTFQSGKVNADFIAQCPQNRMFTKLNFSVRPLEVTKQVLVENIQNTNVDMLQLYFENEGGDVDDLNLNEAEQSAVITFEDCQAVQKVLKKKHHIRNEDIKVYPFYKSLGVALYGKDQPSLKLPAATSEPIDSDIWRYLTNNQAAAQSVRSDMAKHFCDVNLDQSNVRLSPLSLLLTQKDAKATVKDWTTTVKSAFAQTMSKFKSLKFPVESEVWEESEEKIGQSLLNEDVLVVSEKSSGVLSVVGLVNDVNRQEGTVSEVLNKINQAVQREKTVKTQEIKVSPSMFHILSQDGLQDKLLQVSPELKTHYDKEGAVLKVTGLFNEILEVSKIINDGLFGSKRDNLEVDTFVFDIMKDEQQEELTSALLTSVGINAALEISAQRVQLVALSDKDLLDGQDHLRKFLISQYINVEDVEVLKKPEWQGLVGQLENANNKACRITQTPQKVVVSGHKDSVKQVSSELSNFLTQNAHVETTVDVKENVIIDYIKSLDMSWLKDWVDKAAVSFRKEDIFLSGSRASVEQIKSLLGDLVASVSFDSLRISKPGVKKLFKYKDSMLLSTLCRGTGCLVQVVDEDGDSVYDWASVKVHICGGTQAEVDSAKKRITDLISKLKTSALITDSSISHMSWEDNQQLFDIQKKFWVVIRSEIMNGQPSIHIEGIQNDVFEVKCMVYDMLKKVREGMKRNMVLAGRVVDWQYEQGGQFRSFDAMANFQLEQACDESKPSITIKVQGQDYTVVLPNGPATDSQGNCRKIRRNDKLKGQAVPVSWDSMPTDATCLPFLIQPGTTEHTDVLNLFQASCKRPVTKIQRIQNPTLWKAYQAKKQDLELRNKHQNNEKRLFHGTCENTAIKINECGFNRSYVGMNAVMYGNGTYFAVNASYSASDTYSKPNRYQEKIMYLCRVLTGDFCKGKAGMIEAPAKGSSSVEKFNSVVDDEANPNIFVIFHDNQAYPEYLITFQ
ncbi:protein mono-ADP-ribosyltransferase PARP14-like [Cololabis saira]|uniref:protein mono-ADP-ribosyltransferase PARP14-like n=1 Tax=Cololabis saira TaxID=129043 RepID=UPI002AD4A00E|nr:protein mono-ADP-ribosyltransferase PARP14-like [Cololabis saira]